MSIFQGTFFAGSSKSYADLVGIEGNVTTKALSIASIFGALRFIWAFLLEKYSFRKVYGLMVLL